MRELLLLSLPLLQLKQVPPLRLLLLFYDLSESYHEKLLVALGQPLNIADTALPQYKITLRMSLTARTQLLVCSLERLHLFLCRLGYTKIPEPLVDNILAVVAVRGERVLLVLQHKGNWVQQLLVHPPVKDYFVAPSTRNRTQQLKLVLVGDAFEFVLVLAGV